MVLDLRKTFLTVFAAVIVLIPSAVRAEELVGATLQECYKLALKQSETVAIQAQVIKEAQGRFLQALSGILPSVSFEDNEEWQDDSNSSTTRRYVPQRRFTFSQPLFSGFSEFAAMAASKAERRQREQELIRAKQLLFTDVADAFYFLNSYQEDLNILTEMHQALEDRVVDLKKREELGRSRASEVASTEARLYQNEAQLESVRSQQDVARQLLEFLVGQKISSITSEDNPSTDFASIEEAVAKADARPDVRAAKEAANAARKLITVASSGHWPTVDLSGNSYTKRVDSDDPDWDVMLSISVPIFNGTQVWGAVKEAKAIAEQARLRAAQVKRAAILDIQNTYTQLISDERQTRAYKKAVEASQKNFDLQTEDYRKSLVNNLDVLQALEDLQTGKRNYNTIRNETQRTYWKLKAATGEVFDDAL